MIGSGEDIGKALKLLSDRLRESIEYEKTRPSPAIVRHTCNNCKYRHGVEMYDQQWGRFICGHSWCDRDKSLMDSYDFDETCRGNLTHYMDECEYFEEGNGIYEEIPEEEKRNY